MTIRGFIFDLDGVLVDTAKYHYLGWKRLADEIGVPFDEEANHALRGVSRMESLHLVLGTKWVAYSPAEREAMADRKNAYYLQLVRAMRADEIFPGARELLEDLRCRGLKAGLASSSKNAALVLERLGISALFQAVVTGLDITNSKPHPEVFLTAAAGLGLQAGECIVAEDAEAGVEAAHRAGMKCVGIGRPAQVGQAEWIVSGPAELLTRLPAILG